MSERATTRSQNKPTDQENFLLTPKWIKQSSSVKTKNSLRKRIDTFVNDPVNKGLISPEDAKRWEQLKSAYGQAKVKDILELAIDRLGMTNIRRTANSDRATLNQDKVEFLYMEKSNPIPLDTPQNPPAEHQDSNNNQWEFVEKTDREKLEDFCTKRLKSSPTYTTEEITNPDGTTQYKTTVKHDKYSQMNGTGTSPDKEQSMNLAAKHAITVLTQNLDNNSTNAIVPLTQEEDNAVEEGNDNTDINAQILKVMEDNFVRLFKNTLDTMAEDFDKRITTLIETTLDEKIKNSVSKVIDENFTDTIDKKVKEVIKEQLDESFKNECIEQLTPTIKESISTDLDATFNATVNSKKNDITTHYNNVIANIDKHYKNKNQAYTRMFTNDRNILNKDREKHVQEMKNAHDAHVMALQQETNTHLTTIDNNVFEGQALIEDQVQITFKQFHTEVETALQSANEHNIQSSFRKNTTRAPLTLEDDVVYTDSISGSRSPAKVVAVHKTATHVPYYTIRFSNNKERSATINNLEKTTIIDIENTGRFKNVDPTLLKPKTHTNPYAAVPPPNPYVTPTKNPYAPAIDVNTFHKHFKSQLKSNADIVNFYEQLKAQGEEYNILLVDLEVIEPDIDLCPSHVTAAARKKMALAIYQKLQDVDIGGSTYIELKNQMKAQSTTCDGYLVLKELLRHVHPKLKEGKKMRRPPKLSECDNDLYTFNDVMSTFFTSEMINRRKYTEKEKSDMYLENIDDPRLSEAVARCQIDLGIATLEDENVIKRPGLRFSALPTTIAQLAGLETDTMPVIHAMARRQNNNESRGAYKPTRRYEAIQCRGCGAWGHKINMCMTIPKIATVIEWINKNKDKTAALVQEYLRVNNKSTKRSTIRLLQSTGNFNDDRDPTDILASQDFDIEMDEVDFEDLN